ncbi:hypothetical protein [Paenibacillus arenilitoris]|uniref:Uncharacterized protein n=1 Tax=Paenibacillus arenilitoris TaxID=2772299 RepID=A0A927CND3_9BACL|nr:hypothetical protein [Paenibacillus arenilitoris]MBD2870477.1 hypothetical protein [Paenibacillus arenilitoris]
MDIQAVIGAAVLVTLLWLGFKLIAKRGHKREYGMYAAMILWSAYLFASTTFDWPPVTPVTLLEGVIGPAGRWLAFAGFLPE